MNHNYENSSLPSSKCIKRKKITNNREKTGKKPGAQVGHPHHPRKPMKPDQVVEIPTEEKFKDRSRYVPAQTTVFRQVIGIRVIPVVTEYRAVEFYDKKKGRKVHSAFPYGVADDVNYDESMKAVLFLLNSRCSVSLEKTAQFVSNVTEGALSPSVGMISGLCREFSLKSRQEQDELFKALLDVPVMHVDGTVARVNGNNNNVVVCSSGAATMYFARENKGHAGIKGTPVETFGGILIHDHDYPNLNKIQTFSAITCNERILGWKRLDFILYNHIKTRRLYNNESIKFTPELSTASNPYEGDWL